MTVVSTMAIVGMVFTLLMSVGLPIVALVWVRMKLKASMKYAFLGAGVFILFAMLLEPMCHAGMLMLVGEQLTENIWLYALYGGLAAGLFEETGRYFAMRVCMRNNLTKENAVMYGVGHGGAESLILMGLTSVANIALAVTLNSMGVDAFMESLEEATRAEAMEQLSVLWTAAPYTFSLAGLERVAAFVLQICLSYLVYLSVHGRKPALWLLAILIHFLVDAVVVLLSQAIPAWAAECILIAFVACFAWMLWKQWNKPEEVRILGNKLER